LGTYAPGQRRYLQQAGVFGSHPVLSASPRRGFASGHVFFLPPILRVNRGIMAGPAIGAPALVTAPLVTPVFQPPGADCLGVVMFARCSPHA